MKSPPSFLNFIFLFYFWLFTCVCTCAFDYFFRLSFAASATVQYVVGSRFKLIKKGGNGALSKRWKILRCTAPPLLLLLLICPLYANMCLLDHRVCVCGSYLLLFSIWWWRRWWW